MKSLKIVLFVMCFIFAVNNSISYALNAGKTLWRFAGLHERGDIEPSEFCYVTFGNKNILMHWVTPGEPETFDIYRITKEKGNKFCAMIIKSYEVTEYKFIENSEILHKNICGRITENQ